MKFAVLSSAALAVILLAAAPATAKEHKDQDKMAKIQGQERDLSAADKAFLADAAKGNLAEVNLGILTVSHGSTLAMREFGRWMISTHSFANRELTSIAEGLHGTTPPLKSEAKTDDTMGKLQNLKGIEFDKSVLEVMEKDHKEDLEKVGAEAKNGQAPLLKEFAANLLPAVQEHLAQIKLLMADAQGSGQAGAEADANMKAAVGGMGATPQGNTDQAKTVQDQHSGK